MSSEINRREFLKKSGLAAGLAGKTPGVSIIINPDDGVAGAPPARWAARELERALGERGVRTRILPKLDAAVSGDLCVYAAGPAGRFSKLPAAPEALALGPAKVAGRGVLMASGSDVRGLVYALLELADRARYGADPVAALEVRAPVVEQPANRIRSVIRAFVSDVEDRPWYNDRAMWPSYLGMLASERFNRFSLTFGIGYDFPRNIRDCYFHFAYPFLLAVPGYNVRAKGLPDAERDRNLEMLRFISDETAARGLQFQLGLWTHAWQWTDSPNANYLIEGLAPETHAAYCRDALLAVLKACPAITGLTFRVHGESGVPEGSYTFWRTLFEGVVRSGRKIEIDMHAKGMDREMIEVALATGMSVNISPKYWAEHMGLPYHQAAIRELEMPKPDRKDQGFFSRSSGSRSFLRYGYGDLLAEDRRYGVLHRIWPGTQRVLLWGDPVMAAAYGRASSFCGSAGVELCEPLSFKGRKGSGIAGGRCAYADAALQPRYDWEKYRYTYRVWGRLMYNPDADAETWRRLLRQRVGAVADAAENALAYASRILPLVTTAHGASAANNSYWPEMYTNMPIVDAARKHPYGDTPVPKRFGWVSPFDPELFARVDDFAGELLEGRRSGKYSPLEVAQWLDDFADAATRHVSQAGVQAGGRGNTEYRRLATDVAIQCGLGRFFAGKLRSGVLYSLYERSGDRAALEEALKAYRNARTEWAQLARRAEGVYASDVTYGFDKHLRGNWADRLAAIDDDIADMEKRLEQAAQGGGQEKAKLAVRTVLMRPRRPAARSRHTPPPRFRRGEEVALEIALEKQPAVSARLHYRRVNQAERWQTAEMEGKDNRYRGAIPGAYTDSAFPLEYYFELRQGPEEVWLYPGFGPDLANQPYFVVRQG